MEIHITLITIGGLFAIGLATDALARRLRLPRVTLLILFGVFAGPVGLDLMPDQIKHWYEFLATTALTMVAFLLGGALSKSQLKNHGKHIVVISLSVVLITIVLISSGLIFIGVEPAIALILAGIATATAPAAISDVIRQSGTTGDFPDTLQGIVAIDDAWGLIAFSILLIAANGLIGNGYNSIFAQSLWEIGGAIAVGAAVGLPATVLTGRLRKGEPIQVEALAVVFLCAGFAVWLEVSFLLAGVVAGLIVVNFAKHHARAFHEIQHIEWPFLILFFFLAGVSLEMEDWQEFGPIILVYMILRTLSRLIGGWIGGKVSSAPIAYQRWMGLALLPQAGVAIGMALVAGHRFPEFRETILTVTITTTVLFEIFGPLATLYALKKTAPK